MSESWKIKEWDFVLGSNNEKIPQFTFIANPSFISSADINGNNLLITIKDTSCDAYNNKNVKAVVDKSNDIVDEKTKEVIGATQEQPCPCDFSSRTILYTITIPGVCYFDGVKKGSFSLMKERKKPKKKDEGDVLSSNADEDSSDKELTGKSSNSTETSLPVLPLVLIGGVLVTSALLTIFLIRRK